MHNYSTYSTKMERDKQDNPTNLDVQKVVPKFNTNDFPDVIIISPRRDECERNKKHRRSITYATGAPWK